MIWRFSGAGMSEAPVTIGGMNSLANTLHHVETVLGDAVYAAYREGGIRQLGDQERLDLLARVAAVSRLAEAVIVETVAVLADDEASVAPGTRLTVRKGCRSLNELVQRTTRLSSRTVADVIAGASAVRERLGFSSGEMLPAEFPGMRAALADGVIGIDGLVAVTRTISRAACERSERLAADEELAASARGQGVDGNPAPCADELRTQAQVWTMYLDQDGAQPREIRALRQRGLWLGTCRDGSVPVRGDLLPEVAAQLQTLSDAINNPKLDGPPLPTGPHFIDSDADADPVDTVRRDERTGAQRLHDAFAAILGVAARAAEMPTLGGAAPTLVVSVMESELRHGRGLAHLDGIDEPVSIALAEHIGCSGTIQRVITDTGGRVRAIHTLDRVFNAHQRKAITLRDGGCIIPGCHVPAAWCEIHHVIEHSRGGPTHCDNGVLLCWFHHRTLGRSGWEIRMRNGIPEVRGPTWWDIPFTWRAVTTSPIRMRRRLAARRN